MNYVIHSMGMPFNGDTIKTRSLGGSESAAYYMARELADRGHRVIVYTNSPEEGEFDGVLYCHSGEARSDAPLGDKFAQYACNTPHDVLIIQRHPLGFHKDYASKINVHQMHDLALTRSAGAVNAGAARVDMITAVSEFHAKQIREVYGFAAKTVRVVPNGVDPTLYDVRSLLPDTLAAPEGALRYLYQSRPERGLEHLVRPGGIMAKLHEAGAKAHLFVCGYDYTTAEMAEFYNYLNSCAEALPNVTVLGALTKAELAQVQQRCDALVYPTEFEEVSCITAMEAMHAGLPFISSSHAALPETCKDSGSILLPFADGKVDEAAFVETLLTFERSTEEAREVYREAQHEAAQTRTWEHAVDILEEEVARIFAQRASSPARMARHLIEHSDISTFDIAAAHGADKLSEIEHTARNEVASMYSFTKSLEATVEHYRKWEGMNCDRMVDRGMDPAAERAGVMRTTRFTGIAHLLSVAIAEKINAGMPVSVLEFGCAHGHITLLLAEQFPQVQFTGCDFMQRSIDLATKTARERELRNVTFKVGSLDDLAGPYDVVIAPEVVEHIWDYKGALDKLLGAVSLAGELIITTPVGRWEWSGRHWWHKGREHLHHFERQDIVELFQEFPHTILQAPGGHDGAGGALGSWVYSVRKVEGAAVGDIDMARKLATIAPRDTVSLCMIVHNAQETISTALRSMVQYVDEVVISLDPKTDDHTAKRIEEVAEEFPHVAWNVYIGKSPLEIGFDEARNATIDASCGDWIFWLDADEEVVGANNIFRCLRPGGFNAYAIPQHHMSQDPPACITTDHPCRLFRRDSGARFYGVVHEHPEVEIGKAIPHTHSLGDVKVIHYGYSDEGTRRGRYARNFPLLLRDLEKHPGRTLNKFLYIRDLAQGIAFEGEQVGTVTQGMMDSARKVVDLFDKLIDDNPMLRMTLDALPYYSTASATLGGGFNATIKVETHKQELPGVKASVDVEGLFHNRATYNKLLARIATETTVNYEGRYI